MPNGSGNARVNFQFSLASTELSTKILLCPNDVRKVAAPNLRKGGCHGENTGIVSLGDGSVQQLSETKLAQTLVAYDPTTETDEGNLQFFFP